jgi:hypothetical protein
MTPAPKRSWPQMAPGVWPIRPRVDPDEIPDDEMHPDYRATHGWYMTAMWASIAFLALVAGVAFGAMRIAELWHSH